ncbi:MAG: sulfatase-like hydrolase/transferase, partial [Micromonosporaceae bacterium]
MRAKFWLVPALLALALIGSSQVSANPDPGSPPAAAAAKPNIVFIHTDDLSSNLVQHMSEVQALKAAGTSFNHYSVVDSLCCPSRAAMLTGRFPHNTGVRTNKNGAIGGHQAFVANGNPQRTYAVALDDAGYRTGLYGKYMNGYDIRANNVPPGWDEWHVGGDGAYANVAGAYEITQVLQKGANKNISRPNVYLTDLLGDRAKNFIDRAHTANQPFFLQMSTFAPHSGVGGPAGEPRFPPAPRDRPGHDFPGGDCGVINGNRTECGSLSVPRGTGFDEATYQELDTDLRNR